MSKLVKMLFMITGMCIIAFSQAQPVSSVDSVANNIQTVRDFYQASADKSDNNLGRFFASNYQLVDLGVIKNLSNARSTAKNTNVVQRVESARRAFPDFKIKINDIFGQANQVFADVTISGHQNGEFLGIAPSGKSINFRYFIVFTFNDSGKIVKTVQLDDELTMMNQLGYIVLR